MPTWSLGAAGGAVGPLPGFHLPLRVLPRACGLGQLVNSVPEPGLSVDKIQLQFLLRQVALGPEGRTHVLGVDQRSPRSDSQCFRVWGHVHDGKGGCLCVSAWYRGLQSAGLCQKGLYPMGVGQCGVSEGVFALRVGVVLGWFQWE